MSLPPVAILGQDEGDMRRKRAVGDDFTPGPEAQEELLNIPAFLRRQAD